MNKHLRPILLLTTTLQLGLVTRAHAVPVRERAAAAIRQCHSWLVGNNPLLERKDRIFRSIVIAARDPSYRPPWKEFVPKVTPLQSVVDDPEYFYVPANVWNDLLEERFPDTAREAREWHRRQDLESDAPNAKIDLPTPAELPEPTVLDVETAWPDSEPYFAQRTVLKPSPPYLQPSAQILGDAPVITRQAAIPKEDSTYARLSHLRETFQASLSAEDQQTFKNMSREELEAVQREASEMIDGLIGAGHITREEGDQLLANAAFNHHLNEKR